MYHRQNFIRTIALTAIALGSSLSVDYAQAQTPSENNGGNLWQVSLGIGSGFMPRYMGSKNFTLSPIPIVDVTWDKRFFVSTINGVGVYAINSPSFQLGSSLGVAQDVRYHGHNGDLRGLPSIKPGGLASVFATYRLSAFSFFLALRQRIGPVNGQYIDFAGNYKVASISDLTITVGPSVTYANAKLNRGFFGITPQQSRAAIALGNDLPAYRPGAGIRDVALNVDANYRWDKNWSVDGIVKLATLVGQDANSPVTKQKFQPTIAIAMTYNF